MIDYKLFEFAAPPCTRVDWYLKACQLVGLGPGFSYHASEAWDHGDKRKLIRLTLVRNPIDWLVEFYHTIREGKKINGTFKQLSTLDFSTIDRFFNSYLETAQGSVTALYNRYEADIVHRTEDMPQAFLELLDTLEIPNVMKNQLAFLPIDLSTYNITVSPWLRQEIQKAEKEVFERYDYW